MTQQNISSLNSNSNSNYFVFQSRLISLLLEHLEQDYVKTAIETIKKIKFSIVNSSMDFSDNSTTISKKHTNAVGILELWIKHMEYLFAQLKEFLPADTHNDRKQQLKKNIDEIKELIENMTTAENAKIFVGYEQQFYKFLEKMIGILTKIQEGGKRLKLVGNKASKPTKTVKSKTVKSVKTKNEKKTVKTSKK